MTKIKVGIVNYLNTAPLVYGLKNSSISNDIELIADYPARLASDLVSGKIDIGLVPVAVLAELDNWQIAADYGIGCDGEVASVAIFSDVPLEDVTTVLLDYQSRTSVELAKILLRDYWRIDVTLVDAAKDFRKQISGTVAGLVIGDRALEQRTISPYIYDLGLAWKQHTGLPFVFAAWVANRSLDKQFIAEFNAANAYGLSHLNEVIALHPYPHFNLREYYTRNIRYAIDKDSRAGLHRFLDELKVTG